MNLSCEALGMSLGGATSEFGWEEDPVVTYQRNFESVVGWEQCFLDSLGTSRVKSNVNRIRNTMRSVHAVLYFPLIEMPVANHP